jgi:hypothetical protein
MKSKIIFIFFFIIYMLTSLTVHLILQNIFGISIIRYIFGPFISVLVILPIYKKYSFLSLVGMIISVQSLIHIFIVIFTFFFFIGASSSDISKLIPEIIGYFLISSIVAISTLLLFTTVRRINCKADSR